MWRPFQVNPNFLSKKRGVKERRRKIHPMIENTKITISVSPPRLSAISLAYVQNSEATELYETD